MPRSIFSGTLSRFWYQFHWKIRVNSLYCSREDQGLAEWEDNDPSKDTTIYVTFSPGMSTVSLAKGSP